MEYKNGESSRSRSANDFLRTSSLRSLRHLQKDKNEGMRWFWLCIHVLFIGLTISTILALWQNLVSDPIIISLQDTNHPVTEIPFPAISICNLNKISRKRAKDAANYISEATGTDLDTITDYLATLGSLYDFDSANTFKQLKFQAILETLANETFKVTHLMRLLAPSCEELLVSCFWKNKKVNCSKIFQTRLTFEGFCCIFNYIKNTSEIIETDFLANDIEFGYSGLPNGLTVEVNSEIDDYFFTQRASVGIHVFNPTNYPDRNGGGLIEQLVGFTSEFFMQIEASGLDTVKEVARYSVDTRECYFSFERWTSFGPYIESDCLIDCRINSMIALCGCVPFFIPQNRSLICGLSDIQCLGKYKSIYPLFTIRYDSKRKWESLAPPTAFTNENLRKESHYSLDCEDRCYPLCDSYLYETITNLVPIRKSNIGNNSIIHIHYKNRGSSMYKQDVVHYWFDILSKSGGILYLFLGLSLTGLIEVITFCLYKIYNYIYHEVVFDDDFCDFCVWKF